MLYTAATILVEDISDDEAVVDGVYLIPLSSEKDLLLRRLDSSVCLLSFPDIARSKCSNKTDLSSARLIDSFNAKQN